MIQSMDCEIEFLPVGDASKAGDAILVRYGSITAYELMIVDGGNLDSGKLVVEHVRQHFGNDAVISHVVLTHADADHASGLREVLSELRVLNFWMHAPWASADASMQFFAKKDWASDDLRDALFKEYDLLVDLVKIAASKQTTIQFPFAGAVIGPFRVLSPSPGFYSVLLPQFDRTPDADQSALEAISCWLGKQPSLMGNILEKFAARTQKWFEESWANERLKDGGKTSASNESSVILYGDFGPNRRVLLTGDAGIWALTLAANYADANGFPLQDFMLVQIPHHGSRRNVGPSILNRLLGPIQPQGSRPRFHAFVSAPKDDDTHPRQMVLNAFTRRGALVVATQGVKKVHWGGFPPRLGYSDAQAMPFVSRIEDYD
jgi:beta-lactamase superfamily II metal-dependent hydrolase